MVDLLLPVIPLPKMGSFADGFPGGCVKTANIIAQQSAWLAAQQQDDGSWQRPHGYTSNHYDTAWAGLGLMATGDKHFDPQIRKAAEFLAFKAKPDGWAVPSSAVAIFLGEYWLRYRDDRILPSLEGWVNCLLIESMTGDYTAGHGHNPGYRGTGVSTGGSHAAAAFAVASKTPVHFDTTLLDRMLFRVQQLAPDGHVPYGRGRGRAEFVPALAHGATYSGRHGPYLVASLLHGGPRLFTENCTRMYADGPKGGSDQGHATETLSNQWAFIAMAASDLGAYREHLDALRWKITMRRCFDGGFCQSAFRLEYAGGEGLLDFAIRCGSWLVSLCAEKQNLAITGAPAYRAKALLDLPPVQHLDAMLLGCYLRDWAVVDAVLGDRSPEALRTAIVGLQSIQHDPELREKLLLLLPAHAVTVAGKVAAIDSLDTQLRGYLVEMLLGMNIRIDAVGVAEHPGQYEIHLDQEFPLAGLELDPQRLAESGVGLSGSVSFSSAEDGPVPVPARVEFDSTQGVNWGNWHSKRSTVRLEGPKETPFEITATFDYEVAGIPIRYQRKVLFNQGEDYGNGEKQRKVINDRRVWVPGTLTQDHARWNISFKLPSGVQIAAATQGNEILVHEGEAQWISPRDRSLPMGSQGEFCYTSGWQRWEARVPEFRLKGGPGMVEVTSIVSGDAKAPENLMRGEPGSLLLDVEKPVEITFSEPATVRAFDLRAENVRSLRIEAEIDGNWKTIHLGRPGDLVKRPVAIETGKLRIHLEDAKLGAELKLLRLYR